MGILKFNTEKQAIYKTAIGCLLNKSNKSLADEMMWPNDRQAHLLLNLISSLELETKKIAVPPEF